MPDNRKGGGKRFLIRCGLFLLCVASAYGYGRWQGSRVVAGVQAQADAARDSATLRASQGRSEAAGLESLVNMLQARRQLDLALAALDERNFGSAQDQLHFAGNNLTNVPNPPAGANPAVLSRLAQELQQARLVVAEDLAQQRGRILGWIRELDGQLPQPTSVAGTPRDAGIGASTPPVTPNGGAPEEAPVSAAPAAPAPAPGGGAPAAPAVPAPAPGGTQ
jgi:hypothetical protein